MSVENFYNLCVEVEEKNNGFVFFDFDVMCLYCKGRIGAHSEKEFQRCAEKYLGD